MKKLGKKIKHFLAGALAVLLAFQCLPETALAAGMSGGSPYEISTKETLNPTGVSFGISWKEQSGSTYQWDETANTGKTATLVVSYSAKKVRAEGYQPGDLVITLNGIGNANRSRTMEALVGADKAGTATKTRDWTYTWDRVKDTYTLTNNRAIEGGSVFSGYFELVYSFEARETVHGFSQDVDDVPPLRGRHGDSNIQHPDLEGHDRQGYLLSGYHGGKVLRHGRPCAVSARRHLHR